MQHCKAKAEASPRQGRGIKHKGALDSWQFRCMGSKWALSDLLLLTLSHTVSAQGRATSCHPLLAPLGPLMLLSQGNNVICQERDKCCNNNDH